MTAKRADLKSSGPKRNTGVRCGAHLSHLRRSTLKIEEISLKSTEATAMTATIQTLLLPPRGAGRRRHRLRPAVNTAPSILLVIAGIGLALLPGLPRIELAPELVLLGILPPLIYSAGVAMSWREFRSTCARSRSWRSAASSSPPVRWRLAAHWLLGMPLAVAFVLGAIVAPPDVVAPLAIARPLGTAAPALGRARRRGPCQ